MAKVGNRKIGGKQLFGVAVGDHRFIGASTLEQLMQYGLIRPTLNESAKAKDLKHDSILAAARATRETVQRRFDKPRRQRAEKFSHYIERVADGQAGGAPPITLYTPVPGDVDEDGFVLTLPIQSPLVNLDGETQTEARFILGERRPETVGELTIDFVLHHGIDSAAAAAIMHDFNKYAHPVKETQIAPLHAHGPLTAVVFKALADHDVAAKIVNRFRPVPNKSEAMAFQCLLAGGAGASLDMMALPQLNRAISQFNNGGGGFDSDKAVTFLGHVVPLAVIHREIALSKPPVWALAGAIYHDYGKLMNAPEWVRVGATFNLRSPIKGKQGQQQKYRDILRALDLTPIGELAL